jgi:translation initiation factor IF-3
MEYGKFRTESADNTQEAKKQGHHVRNYRLRLQEGEISSRISSGAFTKHKLAREFEGK